MDPAGYYVGYKVSPLPALLLLISQGVAYRARRSKARILPVQLWPALRVLQVLLIALLLRLSRQGSIRSALECLSTLVQTMRAAAKG